jgi:hypothetical protein
MRPVPLRGVLAVGLAVAGVLISVLPAAARRIRLPKPHHGAQIVVGPITVPQGSEATECTYLRFPGRHDLAVNKVDIKVRGGSHHIHLYRPYDESTAPTSGHETCNMAVDFDVWQLVLASQSVRLKWKLPPGIAFHFRAGEPLLAQTHYVDNGLLASPEDGWAVFNLYAMPDRKVVSYAGSLFGQDRDVVVPARSVATATTRCLFPRPVKLLGLTGHYHFRGKRFTASSWDGTVEGPPLYTFDGYTEPLFRRYGGADDPELPGLAWTCTYENDTDETYAFGPFTDHNEHCNLFAFYYPAEGTTESMTCVQEAGEARVVVRH